MRFKRHILPAAVLGVIALAAVLAPDVLAQGFGLEGAQKGTGIPKTTDIAVIIGRILRLALGFVGTLFLLLMVYAGFLWMTARGDSKKVDQAKQLITGAIIGVLIIGSAYAITSLVLATASGDTAALESGGNSDDDIIIEIDCSADNPCPVTDGTTCQDIDPETGNGTCR